MEGGRIIEAMLEEIKTNLDKTVKDLECEVSPENMAKIGKLLSEAASRGVAVGIKEYAEQQDADEQVIYRDGRPICVAGCSRSDSVYELTLDTA